ncbi:MAG: sigma-70 family RNA polymerase sigma factor [bacterium]|nr:sigma-70 family RNA polymerase sigma factor [bacterium]
MAVDTAWDPDGKYLEERIKWAIREVVGQYGLTESDVEDLSQELRLDLLRRLPKHKPARSSRRTFASRLIINKVRTIIAERTAQKRDYRKTAVSLDEEIGGGGDAAPVGDRFMAPGTGATEEGRLTLRIDLETVLSPLPDQHCAICAGLREEREITELARDFGVSRSTIYARLAEIRRRLVEKGYGPRIRPTH